MPAFKRKMLYLGGFDPRGARVYHQLLAAEVARHNATLANSGCGHGAASALTLGRRRQQGITTAWSLHDAAESFHLEVEFLGWDDIVRSHWPRGAMAVLAGGVMAYLRMAWHLDWRQVRFWPRAAWFGLFHPVITVLGCLLVWLSLGLIWASTAGAWWPGLLLLAVLALAVARWGGRRLHGGWVTRFVMFNDTLVRRAGGAALDRRLDHFATQLGYALRGDWDEVLLVSHSNGTILSVPMVAHVLDRHQRLPAHFALVTLGSCIPLLVCRRDAVWFADVADRVARAPLQWLDIGSPSDGACTALVPPFQGRPVATPAGLTQLSPRWFRYRRAGGAGDPMRRHFDYLRRLDRPSPLDFLGLACAARPLAASIRAFRADQACTTAIRATPVAAHG